MRKLLPLCFLVVTCIGLTQSLWSAQPAEKKKPQKIVPPEKPVQFKQPQLGAHLVEVSAFIRVGKARADFNVAGEGLTVAVLDTGLRTTHVDFTGRVVAQRNYTTDNGGNENDASDGNGHGTNVAGIIVANNLHIGIAPKAKVIPIKVLRNDGSGSFEGIDKALQWVIDNRETHKISVVNMSLGDPGNYTTDDDFETQDSIRVKIQTLRKAKVAVVVAAGNGFFGHESKQGMGYPAILRETVSVGAVFDANEGPFEYGDGAKAFSTGPGRITPFSQRLHEKIHKDCRTDIFAPGAPVTSSGIENDKGESIQHGTSQATPVTAGVILLMQEYHLRVKGTLPTVDNLELWLQRGGVTINDGDDEDDNVVNTKETFIRLDAFSAMMAVQRGLQKDLFYQNKPLKGPSP